MKASGWGLLIVLAGPGSLAAQDNLFLQRAQRAFDSLDYSGALVVLQRGLQSPLSEADRALATELLAFSYASLDSTLQAIAAFRDLILVDPDREPDPQVISPLITQLYATALGQVLVVRRIRLDSASFIAGVGQMRLRYQISRDAAVQFRLVGEGENVVIDSTRGAGDAEWAWGGMLAGGKPISPGHYLIRIQASAGREQHASVVPLVVRHAAVDTLPHLTALPGFEERPEMVAPPRNWSPVALSVVAAGVLTGTVLAIEGPPPQDLRRRELFGFDMLAVGVGLWQSLRRPGPQPVQANILYNRLLRDVLNRENLDRSRQNEERRRQVLVQIAPERGPR